MLAALAALSLCAGAERIGVMDVKARIGVKPELSQVIGDAVVAAVRRRVPEAIIVSADDIRNLLGFAQEKKRLGCLDVQCLAEIGGALGVDKIIIGTVSRLGKSLVLDLRLVDAHRARILASGNERIQNGEDDAILDVIPGLVASLFPARPPGASSASAGTPQRAPTFFATSPSEATPASPSDGLSTSLSIPAENPSAGPHPRPLAIILGSVAVAGLALGITGLAVSLGVERASSRPPGSVISNPQQDVNTINLWGNLAVVGGIVAVGGGTAAGLTW